MTIYESCPVIENDNFKLRLVSLEDCCDLLKVYSDEKLTKPPFRKRNLTADLICTGRSFIQFRQEISLRMKNSWQA